ncbi:LamG domain-containing protein [Streptomyces sp. NPDC090741]|uniref:LamG domain-containing protein n=1 Tax=Streptomyces sp. NPDC090741 TaxID=3365967 RepID=UPI0038059C81
MTRRWSLIAVIVALAAALAFVIIDMSGDGSAGGENKSASGPKLSSPTPKTPPPGKKNPPAKGTGRDLKGVGWWTTDDKAGTVAADVVGKHDGVLKGNVTWSNAPHGGALQFDGSTGYADTGAPVLDTVGKDYSVAAAVRLDADGFRTAVSLDGAQASVFFLQYVADQKRFSFSFSNARAMADSLGVPQFGRWYHLVGTYGHEDKTLRIYVDGKLAGQASAPVNPEQPAGNLVIGRGKYQGNQVDFWPGGIGNVHVYDRALTAPEIASLAANEPSV